MLANDMEQALSRVFRTIEGLIQYNHQLQADPMGLLILAPPGARALGHVAVM